MLDMPASEEPTVMEELVEERVVLEPHHLNQWNLLLERRERRGIFHSKNKSHNNLLTGLE